MGGPIFSNIELHTEENCKVIGGWVVKDSVEFQRIVRMAPFLWQNKIWSTCEPKYVGSYIEWNSFISTLFWNVQFLHYIFKKEFKDGGNCLITDATHSF